MQLFAYLRRGGIPQRPDAAIEHVRGCGKDRFGNRFGCALKVDETHANLGIALPNVSGNFVSVGAVATMLGDVNIKRDRGWRRIASNNIRSCFGGSSRFAIQCDLIPSSHNVRTTPARCTLVYLACVSCLCISNTGRINTRMWHRSVVPRLTILFICDRVLDLGWRFCEDSYAAGKSEERSCYRRARHLGDKKEIKKTSITAFPR